MALLLDARTARESLRLEAIRGHGLLDSTADVEFDDFTALARQICATPIALISVVDADRLLFKSCIGMETRQIPRSGSFCDFAIRDAHLFEVRDASADSRFVAHPSVTCVPGVRFYAGVPLLSTDGLPLGTLSVLDWRPRQLAPEQREALTRLARQVQHLLALRRLSCLHKEAERRLHRQAAELRRLATVAEHTNNLVMLLDDAGRVEWCNRAFGQIMGYTPAQIIGRRPAELLHDAETDEAAANELEQAMHGRGRARVQIVTRRADGSRIWLDVDLHRRPAQAGEAAGFVLVATDVSAVVAEREQARRLLQALPAGVIVRDAEGCIIEANAAAGAILGEHRDSLIGQRLLGRELDACDSQGRALPLGEHPVARALAGRPVADEEVLGLRRADGARIWLRLRIAPVHDADGRPVGAISCFADETEERLQRHLLAVARDAARIAPWTLDLKTNMATIDLAAARAMALPVGAHGDSGLATVAWWKGVHRADHARVQEALDRHLANPREPYRAEYRLRDHEGAWLWVLSCGAITERDREGLPQRMAGMLIDITERKRAEDALARAATTDELTGLPNRRELQQRLEQALASARRHGHIGALLMLDLDHFKRINDSLGHAAGDQLLQALAQRVRALLRTEDTLARMGGDEMMVLLPGLGRDADAAARHAQQVAEKLLAALTEPVTLEAGAYSVGASIGFTLFPESAEATGADLLREADTAMYEAKAAGRGAICAFRPDMQRTVARRLQIERALERTLRANGQGLALHLQPKWTPSGALFGAEVLLRWHLAEECEPGIAGEIGPAEFIPVAEDCGLIVPLGRWVLETAMRHAAARRAAGRPLPLAINVSPRQFREPNFVAVFDELLVITGADPHDLTLELTEGVFIEDHESGARRMSELAARGAQLSIDDFGTRHASLMYLKRLPIHELKIDRAFVRDVTHDPDDAALVEVMLAIAARFGIRTVAEGVETAEQADFLIARGCAALQGYLLGQPVPLADFESLFG
jgi:diguanylate cyclase (GGDEF)-like protein/PAS domain S-box-containing protein